MTSNFIDFSLPEKTTSIMYFHNNVFYMKNHFQSK